MRGQPIRLLELSGRPADLGRVHGARYADEIRDYVDDRLERSREGTGWTRSQLLRLAEECLPAHRDYSPDLYTEMEALAEAAGISTAEAMVVGGYTDFIDLVRARVGTAPVEDTCTAVLIPDALADGAGFLAQTWDMHASATPHIVMLRLAPEGKPRALVFTTVGCLGQIGMNDAGVCVGINNLTADDGQVGVTWPFVVRKALEQTDADSALDVIVEAELAGGHSFLVFDRTGKGYAVEAMPTARYVAELATGPLIHTNHCLAPVTQAVEGPRPRELDASSFERLEQAAELLGSAPVTPEGLMELTRDERSICRHPEPPFDYETCGAVIIRSRTGEVWACWGVPSENEYERFELEVSVGG